MIYSKTVKIKWNARNKKRLIDLGYTYTKMNDEFDVKVEHLTVGSNSLVLVKCDYCGDLSERQYQTYVRIHRRKGVSQKDCCNKKECVNTKI